jgi:hypothetical protein
MTRARENADATSQTYIENATAAQALSGTYSTERLYFNDSYQLTGDVTVTGHLALGSIADEDIIITQDGTERTITGAGTLEAGNVLQDTHRTSLTDMTGELGSAVTGSPNLNLGNATFPAGHVRQIKYGDLGDIASGGTDVYFPNSFQFDNAILSSSDVWLNATGVAIARTGHSSNYIALWFSSADGGSLGVGASGHKFQAFIGYGDATADIRTPWAGQYLVTNPNSTTPTYQVYVERESSYNYELDIGSLTMMEITG